MSNNIIDPQPAKDPYDDPVAFLAQFGIEAELVTLEEPTLPSAA